jgi:hypothetical protein
MKRYYVAAVFLISMGGLFAYIRFNQGNTEGAIWIGMSYLFLGVFAFWHGKFQPQLRLVAVASNVVLMWLMAVHATFTGDIVWAVFLCIGSIEGCVLYFFQDTSFVKEKIRPWLGP